MEETTPTLLPMTNRSTGNHTGPWEPFTQSLLKDLLGIFIMLLLNIVALLANTAVMVVIVKAPHLRKFAFVGHLCVVDLICAMLLMPLGIVCSSPFFSSVAFTMLQCQVYIFLNVFLVCSSILTITAISIERYYYIVHPMRYEVKMTLRLSARVLVLIWVKSIILALFSLLGWPVYMDKSSINSAQCFLHWSQSSHRKVFAIIFSIVCFCVPAMVIFTVYCNVYKVARMAARQHSWAANPKNRSDSINSQTTIITTHNALHRTYWERIFGGCKAAITLMVIVGQFLLCWLPYFSFHLHLSLINSLERLGDLGVVVTWLAYSSFTFNPFFYGLLNRQIREEFLKLQRCYCSWSTEPTATSQDGSIQENVLQFLQRTSCTIETPSSSAISSPRNTLDQTLQICRIPGQIPEDFR